MSSSAKGAIAQRIAPIGTHELAEYASLFRPTSYELFANVTASLVDISALRPGTGPSAPAIQSTAGAQALPPTARDAPTRDEMTAALEPADQSQTEIRSPSAETLLRQFQAWAAEQERATILLALFNPRIRVRPKSDSHRPKPC